MTQTEAVAAYFEDEFLNFTKTRGRRTYATQFAKWLGVSSTSLSQWMTGARVPTGENLHKVAAKLGPEIYDLVGQPRLLPDVPEIQKIAEKWPDLSKETREQIMQFLDERLRG